MKRHALLKHLKRHGCMLMREGSKHSYYRNENTGDWSTVPRHNEIKDHTARAICKQLDIPLIK